MDREKPTRVLEDGTKEWKTEKGEVYRESPYGVKEWRNAAGELHREDGPAVIIPDEEKAWYRNGKKHREDGPAVEISDGRKYWYRDGLLHREDGPAIERANGEKKWYREGKCHREDGPACEDSDGTKEWRNKDGLLHREDGPAIELANGDKLWYREGKLHREDGPAIERANGTRVYAVANEECSQEEHKKVLAAYKEIVRFDDGTHTNIDRFGAKVWLDKEERLHRENGPAVIYPAKNYVEFYKHGNLHREDGPATLSIDGKENAYYLEGEKTNARTLVGKMGFKMSNGVPMSEKQAKIVLSTLREERVGREQAVRSPVPSLSSEPSVSKENSPLDKSEQRFFVRTYPSEAFEKAIESGRLRGTNKVLEEYGYVCTTPRGDVFQHKGTKEYLAQPYDGKDRETRLQQYEGLKAKEFLDRGAPIAKGAARDYYEAAAKYIVPDRRWPGPTADEKIAKELLQKGHDICRIRAAIQTKSPEALDLKVNDAREYAKQVVDKQLTPEVKKERARSVSRGR